MDTILWKTNETGLQNSFFNEDFFEPILNKLDYAFQPIVNTLTGECFGMEALLRNVDETGFESIEIFFESLVQNDLLYKFETRLFEKALRKFRTIPENERMHLFYNIDNRLLNLPEYRNFVENETGGFSENICLELSEKSRINYRFSSEILKTLKKMNVKIAVDDFGAGYSGLQELFRMEPDFIKIDRFFIEGIETDNKKKLFVSSVVNLAKILGIEIIAEGVETEAAFHVCRELGCDYVQGFLIQRPSVDVSMLLKRYSVICDMTVKDQRNKEKRISAAGNMVVSMDPVQIPGISIRDLFDVFRTNDNISFIPVINDECEPLGIILESDLKKYVYSPFGSALLMNKSAGIKIESFIRKRPVADISTQISRIVDIFYRKENREGIIITENGKYIGILTTLSILSIVNEINISAAQDQNPLTRLPGNRLINEYISAVSNDVNNSHLLIYFDIDNFKPFNDQYGFRIGDRAILMFSGILSELTSGNKVFNGHIGGDDFFSGITFNKNDFEKMIDLIKRIISKFANDVISLYSKEDRDTGLMLSLDREGNIKRFPLLTVSAAVIVFDPCKSDLSRIDKVISTAKKKAKISHDHIFIEKL